MPGILIVLVTGVALTGGHLLTLGTSTRWTFPILGGYLMGVALTEVHGIVPLAFIMGFFLQIILEHFSGGIEHAHPFRERLHYTPQQPQFTQHVPPGDTAYLPVSIIVAVGLHMLIEGLPVGMLPAGVFPPWLWGVLAHRVLEAFLVMQVLRLAPRKTALATGSFLLVVSAVSVFAGAILPEYLWMSGEEVMRLGKSLVLGALLYIGSMLMRETATPAHRYTVWQILAMAAGASLAVLIHHFSV